MKRRDALLAGALVVMAATSIMSWWAIREASSAFVTTTDKLDKKVDDLRRELNMQSTKSNTYAALFCGTVPVDHTVTSTWDQDEETYPEFCNRHADNLQADLDGKWPAAKK